MLWLLAASAIATGQPPAVVTNPDWERLPSAADLGSAYPPGAEARGIEGRVVLNCRVEATGLTDDCRIVSETPMGAGFGQAALGLSRKFRMRPATRNGVPEPARVTVPVRFSLDGSTALQKQPAWRWAGIVAIPPVLALALMLISDFFARGPRAPVRLRAVIGDANAFVWRAWLAVPGPLLVMLAGLACDDVSSALASPWGPLAACLGPATGALGALLAAGAACRLAFGGAGKPELRFRRGILGFAAGAVEGRLLGACIVGACLFLGSAGAAVIAALAALAAAGAAAAALGHAAWAQALAAGVLGSNGLQALLLATVGSILFLVWTRISLLAPLAVHKDMVDVPAAWRLGRGAWFVLGLIAIATAVILAAAPMGVLAARGWLRVLAGQRGELASALEITIPMTLFRAWFAPFLAGTVLSVFKRLSEAATT
jgi:TonB family protein